MTASQKEIRVDRVYVDFHDIVMLEPIPTMKQEGNTETKDFISLSQLNHFSISILKVYLVLA